VIRKIIKIDPEKCDGCGLCVSACHEGAIGLVDGKAALLRDDYCDGLGDCLPACPTGAITFEERDALAYNEEEVKKRMAQKERTEHVCDCPGGQPSQFHREEAPRAAEPATSAQSELRQWPVQIKLVPTSAPYFEDANLLVAVDCAAFAHGDFHKKYMRNKMTVIGCPKLDDIDYSEKLTAILANNNIKSVTVVRMEVPCCGGIEQAVKTALRDSGKMIPWRIVTLSADGRALDE